ncbi:MAG: hypothetical protein J6K32_10865 [Clostridia bacterium]|nr:hypothetical protein [Clostridia bacterium]
MKSDLTCPVEVVSVRIGREKYEENGADKEQLVCVIEFFNLSDKLIDSVQMNIICFAADGSRVGGRLVRSAVEGEARARFSAPFMPEHVDGTERVEASVEKVWFKDGMVWRREERNVREYTPNTLPEGRELDRLRAAAGADAVGYAREDDIVWMCVCGRANRTSDEKCRRCERERQQVLRDYSFAAVDATVGRKERDLEEKTKETLRRSSEETVRQGQSEQKKTKRRKRRMRLLIALLLLVIIALAAARWGVPYAAGLYAAQEMEKGHAADAKEIYLFIERWWPGFGAGDKADEAEKVIIEGLITAGNNEALADAAARALQLGTKDGSVLHERAVLARAQLAIDADEDAKAEELLTGLADSEAAQTMLRELIYSIAAEAKKQTNYPLAIERFASLGEYMDAQEQQLDSVYLYGRQLMREGSYAAACDQFLIVSDREDAVALIRQCRYALAGELMEQDEYVEAAKLYETLGIYEEAETRAEFCRYSAGMNALEEGRLEEAVRQLALAGDYEDAQEQYVTASYTLGCAAMTDGRYADAIGWLEQLEREGEVAQAYEQAVYTYARQLEDAGQLEPAQQQFALVGDYEDAAQRLRSIEYRLAVREMEQNAEAALARFESLGNYEDSANMANACRYMIAAAAFDAGEYEDALKRFEALGTYEDSEGQAQRSRYALGAQTAADGDYETAAALYEACGVYLDAEERAMRARYSHAEALEKAGDHEAASKAFAALGSYEDAKRRTTACEDAWLGAAYTAARMDAELGDHESVIKGLEPYWQSELPERYAQIAEMYREACLSRAEALITLGKPLDALPVLERVPDSRRAQKLIEAYVYGIIGRWKDTQGGEYIFRRDGSCSILGEEGYFGGAAYDIFVGSEPYPTKTVYSVISLKKASLTLRREEDGKNLRLSYLGEAAPAEQTEEAAKAPEAADSAEETGAQPAEEPADNAA